MRTGEEAPLPGTAWNGYLNTFRHGTTTGSHLSNATTTAAALMDAANSSMSTWTRRITSSMAPAKKKSSVTWRKFILILLVGWVSSSAQCKSTTKPSCVPMIMARITYFRKLYSGSCETP
ncbi:uncharacterized protein [Melopsittacus undulatus]|uniref:uncharacterized protein isoform X2 n=1 Tax=Melopsittacus undulatus TaxID=13146 RepID=UPI00146F39B5|nr:uncharacterized protein LOC101877069 isoform X2 [Melopsittacus undulatus]